MDRTTLTVNQFVGQVIYAASRHRIFSYPEERPGFEIPEKYRQKSNEKPSRFQSENANANAGTNANANANASTIDDSTRQREVDGRRSSEDIRMAQDYGNGEEADRPAPDSRNSDETIVNEGDNGQEVGKEGKKDDTIVVDWYGPDDPENPQNWYVHHIPHERLSDILQVNL